MANDMRNKDYSHYASDENWDRRHRNEDRYQPDRDDYNRVNYIPDNDDNRQGYNKDFDSNAYGNRGYRQEGSYGQQGGYGNTGYNEGDYNRGYNQDQWQQQQGRNRDMRNVSYGSVYGGNLQRREEETNKAMGGRYSGSGRFNQGRDYNDRGFGNEGYGSNYEANYGSSSYNRNRDRYDNDNRDNRNEEGWWDRTKNKVSNWFDDDDDDDRNRDTRSATMYGPHRGKGPKGYSRSDERILEDVSDRLSDDDRLDASDIEITVQGSEVILSGRVEDKEAKRRAEDLAERVSGVSNVQNNLKVSPIVGTRTTNAVISAVAEKNNPTYANQIDKDKNKE